MSERMSELVSKQVLVPESAYVFALVCLMGLGSVWVQVNGLLCTLVTLVA